MERSITSFRDILDSEMFGNERRQYYFVIKLTRLGKPYLRITRRDVAGDYSSRRTQLILFEDDLFFFVEALSLLLGRLSYGQTGSIN